MILTAEQQRQTWQYRAIEMTRGNQTLIGTTLLAILNKSPKNPPRFLVGAGAGAMIGEHGEVRCTFQRRDGQVVLGTVVAPSIEDFVATWRRLADLLKLNDADRNAMFNEVRKWITRDLRPNNQRGDLFP